LLCTVTTVPPAGAAPVSVTVAVASAPPTTRVGLMVKLDRVPDPAGFTVRDAEADCVELGRLAVTVMVRLTVTTIVVTVNVADVCPAGILSEIGTWAMVGLSDRRLIVIPVIGAGSPTVTVPLTVPPPVTALDVKATWRTGAMVSWAVLLVLPNVAVRVAVCETDTAVVGMENVVELAENGTVTLAGGCAAGLSLAI